MPDMPSDPSPVITTATVAGLAAVVPTLLFSLPDPWGLVIAGSMVTCSCIVAAIPPPKDNGTKMGKVLIAGYNFVRIGAVAMKYAIPYLVSRGSRSAAPAQNNEATNVPPVLPSAPEP